MILLPLPDELNGTQLTEELRDAGFVEAEVVVVEDRVRVVGVSEDEVEQVEQVVAAHVPEPPPAPEGNAMEEADELLRSSLEANSDVSSVKAALLTWLDARSAARG